MERHLTILGKNGFKKLAALTDFNALSTIYDILFVYKFCFL